MGLLHDAYPVDVLPEYLCTLVKLVSSETKTPPELSAANLISILSGVLMESSDVKGANKSLVPIGIYSVIIAESGVGKTVVADYFLEELKIECDKFLEKYKEELNKYTADQEIYNLLLKVLQKKFKDSVKTNNGVEEVEKEIRRHQQNTPKKPRRRMLVCNDSTPEALFKKSLMSWPFALVNNDEGSSFFNNLLVRSGPALLNQAWDGSGIDIQNVSHGEIFVQNARLAINVGVQPDIWDRYCNKHGEYLESIGLLPRMIFTVVSDVDPKFEYVSENLKEEAWSKYRNFIKFWLAKSVGDDGEPIKERLLFKLSDEAEKIYENFCNHVHLQKIKGGIYADAKNYSAKLNRQVLKFAAIFEAASSGGLVIAEESMWRAIKIVEWHVGIYVKYIVKDQAEINANVLRDWLFKQEGYVPRVMKNHILQRGPSQLRKKTSLDAAIDVLQAKGLVNIVREYNQGVVIVFLGRTINSKNALQFGRRVESHGTFAR